MKEQSTFLAPMIYLKKLAPAIEFYKKAFNAIGLRRWSNDDGSVHVAGLMTGRSLFHRHEEVTRNREWSPETLNGTSIAIALLVTDPDAVMAKAVATDGTEIDLATDHDYQNRQGCLAE